jgi:CRISPR-associated protein Cmr6
MNERRRGQGPPAGRAPGQSGQEGRGSGNAYVVPLPAGAREAWRVYGASRCQNAALVFDRFAPRWDNVSSRQEVGAIKQQGLKAVRQAAEKADKSLVAAWNQRWQAAARFVRAEPFTAKTDWRLITGLGRKGPLEVGFTFHRYGLPYLPASGVKGLARTAGLLAVAAALGEKGLAALRARCIEETQPRGDPPGDLVALAWALALDTDKAFTRAWDTAVGTAGAKARELAGDFRAIFGTTGTAGQAVFLDGIPERVPTLDLDIMNPHYPEYYRDGTGKTAPTDWQSPVPVFFLTVAAGTPFRFAVGWRGPRDSDGQWQRRRVQAVTWLRQGLEELGAGGKTGAGYGYFLAPVSPTTPPAVAATATRPAETRAPAPTPPPAEEPLVWRTGIVREFQPQRGGYVVDEETSERLRFRPDVIVDKGWSPANKGRVQYVAEEREGRRVVTHVRQPR